MTKRNIATVLAFLMVGAISLAFVSSVSPFGRSGTMSAGSEAAAEAKVVSVTESNYVKEVLSSDTPVLVDLGAPWCGPCRRMEPVFKDVSAEYRGKVKFVKVNTDNDPGLARAYGVRGIPTLVLVKKNANGELVFIKSSGARGHAALRSFINDGLKPGASTTPVPDYPKK